MKTFFSAQKLSESGDDVFGALIDLIDSKYVSDKSQILRDIALRKNVIHESDAEKKFISYGDVHVHTVRTSGIKEFCLSCAQMSDGHVEIVLLWNDISEHILGKLAELTKFLEASANQNSSCEHILYELKKL